MGLRQAVVALLERLIEAVSDERQLSLRDHKFDAECLFFSFLVLSCAAGIAALAGCTPPDPSVHWPGHSWIHFMKRFHVVLSIGCFLMQLCASFFSLFALHRVLAGGFNTVSHSTAELLMRELEFEFVAVSSYFLSLIHI